MVNSTNLGSIIGTHNDSAKAAQGQADFLGIPGYDTGIRYIEHTLY